MLFGCSSVVRIRLLFGSEGLRPPRSADATRGPVQSFGRRSLRAQWPRPRRTRCDGGRRSAPPCTGIRLRGRHPGLLHCLARRPAGDVSPVDCRAPPVSFRMTLLPGGRERHGARWGAARASVERGLRHGHISTAAEWNNDVLSARSGVAGTMREAQLATASRRRRRFSRSAAAARRTSGAAIDSNIR